MLLSQGNQIFIFPFFSLKSVHYLCLKIKPMDISIIEGTIKALINNNFEVFRASDPEEARTIFLNEIYTQLQPATVSWGDSQTLQSTHVLDDLEKNPEVALIRTFGAGMSRTQKVYWRRQALLADLFLAGTNAVTQKGQLVNLDMIGNRVGGITFGPKNVVLFIGVNKIVPDIEAAMQRIRTWTAPQNILRHQGFNTPCRKTGTCMDCRSPHRICNTWTITEKSWPAGRIKIILIHQELGL